MGCLASTWGLDSTNAVEARPSCGASIPAGAGQKRIPSPFSADGRLGPVPGEQPDRIRQVEDVIADTVQQNLTIASGQIETTDSGLEDEIPAKDNAFMFIDEDDVARAVTRGVAHLEGVCPQLKVHTVVKSDRRLGAGIETVYFKEGCTALSAPKGLISRVQGDWNHPGAPVGERRGTPEVVEVRVGEPYVGDAPCPMDRLTQDLGAVPGGVYHDRPIAAALTDQIGIGLRRPLNKSHDFQRSDVHGSHFTRSTVDEARPHRRIIRQNDCAGMTGV